jgi:dTDP-4-amino-4,6-dideoxygalactose transaminase
MSATIPKKIPFNRPCLAGREVEYIQDAVRGGHASGDGPYTRKCRELLEQVLGVPRVLLTTSCTHALEMSALLLDLGPGDEVVVPSFTFVSTVNAFVLRGARPVFIDIRPDTLNTDETQLEGKIGERTKAVVPVHYAGVGCAMDRIMEIAGRRRIAVIEDNAHGLFGRTGGRWLGTIGALGTLSFHETKNFICGEGGALLLNDPKFTERAEILREKGTNRARFFRGEVDKYSWVDLGSSYLPSDLLAAFLYAQLEQREAILAKRRRVWERYDQGLQSWARDRGIQTPAVPAPNEQSYHMYYLVLPKPEQRDALIATLKAQAIHAVFHYVPLHLSEMGRRFGGKEGDCPVTESMSARLVRLPFYNDLTTEDQDRIISAIREWR